MSEYTILRKEIHYSIVKVDADSLSEAVAKVVDGDGEEVEVEYSHTLPECEWKYVNSDGGIESVEYK
jgi:hypothetical protein